MTNISETGSQTPASEKRRASDSLSLPLASQPSMPPSRYKNRTPIIATGIKPMSELRQNHPGLRVLKIKQTQNSWIFIGDTSKDLAILQSEPQMQQIFRENVKVSLPKCYHSADAIKGKVLVFKGVSNNLKIEDCLISAKSPSPKQNE